jgi:hypothetical protein
MLGAIQKSALFPFSTGFAFSVLLAVLEALRHRDIWMILQLPGFLAGASIWGVHSGGNGFEIVMVVVNGILYSALLLIVYRMFWLIRRV